MSQVKELLDKLAFGDFTSVIPQSRIEACLMNCLAGLGTEGLPPPMNEAERYLHELAEKVAGGFGGGPVPEMRDFAYLYSGGRRLSEIPLEELIPYMRNGTDFTSMFESCKSLPTSMTIPLGRGSCDGMFSSCSSVVSIEFQGYSKPTSVAGMFKYCGSLTSVTGLDTSECTDFSYMFESCGKLTKAPAIDTSKGTNFMRMFAYGGTGDISNLDLSNGTNFESMFVHNRSVEDIGIIDISNATNINQMFCYSYGLTRFPFVNFGKCTALNDTFNTCTFKTVSGVDFKQIVSLSYTFCNCSLLESLRDVDCRSVTSFYATLQGCKKLTDLYLYNIKTDLTIGSGTSFGHLLTLDSLINTIKELRNVNATRTLTMGTTNIEKLANVYIKLIDITDEMRSEDEFVDEKLPFEVCESTDEGAMLITDYVGEKNWIIK